MYQVAIVIPKLGLFFGVVCVCVYPLFKDEKNKKHIQNRILRIFHCDWFLTNSTKKTHPKENC